MLSRRCACTAPVGETGGLVGDLTRLGVSDAAALLAQRGASASELTAACLARIRDCDGAHSHEGDPGSINAWVRVYEEDAVAAAALADEHLSAAGGTARGAPPTLTGVPVGLKDLYGVAGKPVTASSRLLDDVPARGLRRVEAPGCRGHGAPRATCTPMSSPPAGRPTRSAAPGPTSAPRAARAAARRPRWRRAWFRPPPAPTPRAPLRIPSACCGTSTIKPTRGRVSLAGVVPLSWSLDHAGPMARTLADCRLLLAAMAGPDRGRAESALHAPEPEVPRKRRSARPLAGVRLAVSPRATGADLDEDVAAGFELALDACRRLGATLVDPPPPGASSDVGDDFLDVLTTEMLVYHRRFDGRRELYRPVAARVGRGGRAACRDRRGVRRRAGAAPGADARLGGLAGRAPPDGAASSRPSPSSLRCAATGTSMPVPTMR